MRTWIRGLALVGVLAGGTALVGGCRGDNPTATSRDVKSGEVKGGLDETDADKGTGGSGQQFDARGVRQGDPGSGLHSLPDENQQPSDGKMMPRDVPTAGEDTNFNARGEEPGNVGSGFQSIPGPGKEPSEGKMMPRDGDFAGEGGSGQAGQEDHR